MRIAIATVRVPFEYGGAEFLAENLKNQLIERGHEPDIVTIPFKWNTAESLTNSIRMAKMVELSESKGKRIELVIALKFPMYYANHENKVLWLLHQHREAYELWGTGFHGMDTLKNGGRLRKLIMNDDSKYIPECRKVYTISKTVSGRLKKYNGIDSTPLYHPPFGKERFHHAETGDYIFCPSRLEQLKRQQILIESLRYTKTPVKVLLAGTGKKEYIEQIAILVETHGLSDRVHLLGWVPETQKISLYANALAVYYGPFQEDYGYVTLEAFLAGKPVITLIDSGGPLEFVRDGENGFVLESDPQVVAEKLDYLYENKPKAESMGMNGMSLIKSIDLNWDCVIDRLLGNGRR
ncbi:glycosyltransferase family 4 protein [Paenibacillus alkalitolerans]|uniref:glycosyltransferase family 4 protein n=1 Tax=Paenibacillus alkalitolerans TaxID=2799335 RepID=UPI0018F6C06D|nr:glycosyltransferase family 4 protein [Paenibacillus alkalitolerans]